MCLFLLSYIYLICMLKAFLYLVTICIKTIICAHARELSNLYRVDENGGWRASVELQVIFITCVSVLPLSHQLAIVSFFIMHGVTCEMVCV